MTTAETHSTDRLLTVEQVAARLQVSKPTIYRLISNGQLPALQLAGPGSTLRISQREVEAWLGGRSTTERPTYGLPPSHFFSPRSAG